jgi:hypothetical protein
MYSQVGYIPNANPQLHHLKKPNISLNSRSSSNWNYFLGVMDVIHKNTKHLWVFDFLLVAPSWECLRDSGRVMWGCWIWVCDSLCFSVLRCLSQVLLQGLWPETLKVSKTLSLTCADSSSSISSSYWSWIIQPQMKGLEWMEWLDNNGNTEYKPYLKSSATITVYIAKNQFTLRLRSVTTEDTDI